MKKSHGMESSVARKKKIDGHKLEYAFAQVIDGKVYGQKTNKVDVIKGDETYSLKGGDRSQIFLYSIERFKTNTEFKAFELNQNFINCLKDRDKIIENMKIIKERLLKKHIREAFFSKAFFNSNAVKYLVIFKKENNVFYVFRNEDVLDSLMKLNVNNSKGDRKVIFKSNVNVLELEVRSDKNNMLFVCNLQKLLTWLLKNIEKSKIREYELKNNR